MNGWMDRTPVEKNQLTLPVQLDLFPLNAPHWLTLFLPGTLWKKCFHLEISLQHKMMLAMVSSTVSSSHRDLLSQT